jgi:prolyl 4-hydroxylase
VSNSYGGYMDNLVRIYNDIMTDEKCQYFVDKFEAHPEMQETQNNSQDKTLTFINLMSSPDTPFREDLGFLSNLFMQSVEKYKKDCDIKPFQFPEKFGVEAFKIKRYLPDTTDEFPAHVDVRDYATARRFLVMFVYLTDNYAGQTQLEVLAGTSPCRRGSILLFPPMWPWIHAGKAPVKNPKYIMGSYLQYV